MCTLFKSGELEGFCERVSSISYSFKIILWPLEVMGTGIQTLFGGFLGYCSTNKVVCAGLYSFMARVTAPKKMVFARFNELFVALLNRH